MAGDVTMGKGVFHRERLAISRWLTVPPATTGRKTISRVLPSALTGSRKVGVISHVERLRERIRTHIEVTRNGQSPSEVRVVANASS